MKNKKLKLTYRNCESRASDLPIELAIQKKVASHRELVSLIPTVNNILPMNQLTYLNVKQDSAT